MTMVPTAVVTILVYVLGCRVAEVATGYVPQASAPTKLDIERISNLVNELLGSSNDDLDPSVILQDFVKHPLPVNNFTLPLAGANIECFDVLVHGLNTVQINDAMANISGQFITFSLSVPLVQLSGQQRTSGYVSFVALDARGGLQLNMSDVTILGNASLISSKQGLRVGGVHAQLEVGDISLGIEGLSDLTQSLLNFAAKEIFDYTKQSMLEDFQQAMTRYANEELLRKIPVNITKFDHDIRLIDMIIERTCQMLTTNGHDPQQLKPFHGSIDRMFIQGELLVSNASLAGLATLRRTGEVTLLYGNRALILEANFGFANLSTTFDWSTKLLGVGPKGTAQLIVTDTTMHMRILLALRRGAKLQVDQIEFLRIGHVLTDIQGLGTGDAVGEIILNLLSNIFKYDLANFIIEATRGYIQEEINSIDIAELSRINDSNLSYLMPSV